MSDSSRTTPADRAAPAAAVVGPAPVIRVALIGFGWAGRSIWLPRLLADADYRVVSVVDPAPGLAAELADLDVQVLADQAGLDPVDVDLAVVAVPNHLHAEVAAALLRRGISVFVEKPVCLSGAEADLLAEAERSTDAVLLAGSASRYRRDVRALYDLVAGLGPVRHADLAWVRARGVPGRDGWFTQRELAGGGALVDLGWHLLDAAQPLLGSPTITQVTGSVSGDFLNRQSSRAAWRAEDDAPAVDGDVEDTARGFLLTETGVSVAVRASWASHEALDRTEITVEAAGGTATLRCTFGFSPNRAGGSTLTHTANGVTSITSVGEPIGDEYARQLAELPAILADPQSKGQAIEDTRRTIGVIERLYRSASGSTPAASAPIGAHVEMTPPMIDLRGIAPLASAVATGDPARPGWSARSGSPTRSGSAAGRRGAATMTGFGRPRGHGGQSADGRRPLRAVIFDMDGVLVDSYDVMRQAFECAYAEVVGPGEPPFAEYNRHLGRYFPEIMEIMGLPLAMQEPFVRESYRLADQVPMFDGVRETVAELRAQGLRTAVATGKSGDRARSLLKLLGMVDQFDHVIGGDEVAHAKPAPDMVLRALELLKISPQETFMVGDAVTDIISARGASVASVAALWGGGDSAALLAQNPDAVLSAPAEILDFCRSWNEAARRGDRSVG